VYWSNLIRVHADHHAAELVLSQESPVTTAPPGSVTVDQWMFLPNPAQLSRWRECRSTTATNCSQV
jgi:hypothetical protein